jgi:hypothetical protein
MRTVSPLHEWDEDVATNGVEAAKPMTFYIDRAIAAARHEGRLEGAKAALLDVNLGMGTQGPVTIDMHVLLDMSAARIVAKMENGDTGQT